MKKDHLRKSYYLSKIVVMFISKEAKKESRSDSNALEMMIKELQEYRATNTNK